MEKPQQCLLGAVRAALGGGTVPFCPGTPEEWQALVRLAEEQKLLPMVLDVLIPAARSAGGGEGLEPLRREVLRSAMAQAARTRRLEELCAALDRDGLRVLVVKGLVCRSLYPKPDLRPSGDEDMLARDGDLQAVHETLTRQGLRTDEADGLGTRQVVTYLDPETGLRVELHRRLFPEEAQAYGGMNACFQDAFRDCVPLRGGEKKVWTLPPEEHLLYLILHSLKHFLHSGFGVRQVCDISLAAAAWGEGVDWDRLFQALEEFHGGCFAAALLTIGGGALGMEARYPGKVRAFAGRHCQEDTGPLLEDLLSAGVYGGSSEARRHSSLITLHAFEGRRRANPVGALFPSARELSHAYPYLEEAPWLLPKAWAQRLLRYLSSGRGAASAKESAAIGARRVELLRKYRVIR